MSEIGPLWPYRHLQEAGLNLRSGLYSMFLGQTHPFLRSFIF